MLLGEILRGKTETKTTITTDSTVYTKNDRPDWQSYYLFLAFAVATRSDDLFVKAGSIIVDDASGVIIGTGYNNSIRQMPDGILNPTNRNYRRKLMYHSERNALSNCLINPLNSNLKKSIYITGCPCLDCLQAILQHSIHKVVYVDKEVTITENEETRTAKRQIQDYYSSRGLCSFVSVSPDNPWVQKGMKLLEPNQI